MRKTKNTRPQGREDAGLERGRTMTRAELETAQRNRRRRWNSGDDDVKLVSVAFCDGHGPVIESSVSPRDRQDWSHRRIIFTRSRNIRRIELQREETGR